jgi:hypothetical protein
MKQEERVVTIRCDLCNTKIVRPSPIGEARGFRVTFLSDGLSQIKGTHLCEDHADYVRTTAMYIEQTIGVKITMWRLTREDWD